jgi:predicted Fe-Mo cluster-binding NifX family protein
MKIAIPLFGNRISPWFEFSPEVWIIELKNGEVQSEERFPTNNLSLAQRLDQLALKGVNKIICGGIDGLSLNLLGSRGIGVIHNVVGEAQEGFNLFLRGLLRPGFCCDRKGRRGFCAQKRGFK